MIPTATSMSASLATLRGAAPVAGVEGAGRGYGYWYGYWFSTGVPMAMS